MDSLTDGLPGAAAPVLAADLLGRLAALNLDYLDLLIAEAARPAPAGMRSLPDPVLATLRKADRAALRLLASAAFSLYSLGFEDQEFWRTALRMDVRIDSPSIDVRYGVAGAAVVRSSFCEIALLHAWHVAVSRPLAARLLLGMSATLVDTMTNVQLWQLRRIAVHYPGLLMPRWPANPCFWPEMVKFAVAADARRLHALQQLGHQLLAIDLLASRDRRSAVRQRQHNLLKQRLQLSRLSR
jgi:hypothetical protein